MKLNQKMISKKILNKIEEIQEEEEKNKLLQAFEVGMDVLGK